MRHGFGHEPARETLGRPGGRWPGRPRPWHTPEPARGAQLARGRGARCYIAVAGGLATPAYLGARATFPSGRLGGTQVRPARPPARVHPGLAQPCKQACLPAPAHPSARRHCRRLRPAAAAVPGLAAVGSLLAGQPPLGAPGCTPWMCWRPGRWQACQECDVLPVRCAPGARAQAGRPVAAGAGGCGRAGAGRAGGLAPDVPRGRPGLGGRRAAGAQRGARLLHRRGHPDAVQRGVHRALQLVRRWAWDRLFTARFGNGSSTSTYTMGWLGTPACMRQTMHCHSQTGVCFGRQKCAARAPYRNSTSV